MLKLVDGLEHVPRFRVSVFEADVYRFQLKGAHGTALWFEPWVYWPACNPLILGVGLGLCGSLRGGLPITSSRIWDSYAQPKSMNQSGARAPKGNQAVTIVPAFGVQAGNHGLLQDRAAGDFWATWLSRYLFVSSSLSEARPG